MGERTDDLDTELEDIVETSNVGDVEGVGSLEDGPAVDDIGLDTGRGERSGIDPIGADTRTDSDDPGRIRSWLGSLFSVRWFGAATVASGAGVLAAGAIPLPFTGYLGVFVAGGLLGLVGSERRYLEVATAGALATGLATFFDAVALVLLAVGIPFVAIAAVLGAVAGTVGHYAGRDLRHGLTRDL
jgi:hypothetical protein